MGRLEEGRWAHSLVAVDFSNLCAGDQKNISDGYHIGDGYRLDPNLGPRAPLW